MTQNDANMDWVTTLMGEKLLFGLLGKILYTELDRTWLQSLINEEVFAEVPFGATQSDTATGLELLQKWTKENQSGMRDSSFDDLRSDYSRLFMGVGKVWAPPWESVYFNDARMVFQEQTLQVREWFRRFGLEAEKIHQEPDDHIGLELLFLSHLASLGVQALNEQDNARFEELLEAQRKFFKKHPGAWALTWCGLVENNAKTDFYKGLNHLVRGALTELSEALAVKLTKDVAQ